MPTPRRVRRSPQRHPPGTPHAPASQPPRGEVADLQRAFGNQAVQRFAAQGTLDALQRQQWLGNRAAHHLLMQRAVIQRTGTGLMGDAATGAFAKKVFDACANKESSLDDFRAALVQAVNDELKTLGAPPVSLASVTDARNEGEFSPSLWTLMLNDATLFADKKTVADLKLVPTRKMLDTVYHEARHAEQFFRIARMRAGSSGLTAQSSPEERAQGAKKIADEMGIPPHVALAAAQRPLVDSAQSAQDVGEAQAWEASIYGVNSTYRQQIVLGGVRDDARKLRDSLNSIQEKAKEAALPDIESLGMMSDDDLLLELVDSVNNTLERLKTDGTDVVRQEIERLSKTASTSTNANNNSKAEVADADPNDQTMLKHLQALQKLLNALGQTKLPENPKEPRKLPTTKEFLDLVTFASTLNAVLYQSYLDLPEEADAWKAGAAARDKHAKL